MATCPNLLSFYTLISQNDIVGCKNIFKLSSKWNKERLINSEVSRGKTALHIAADPKVGPRIWNLLLPYASEDNLYHGINPLRKIIPYKAPEQSREDQNIGFVRPKHQLNKIRCWLDLTKKCNTYNVNAYKNHFLCKLCRLKGSDKPGYLSDTDITDFAENLIVNYNTDPNGDGEHRPLIWAIAIANIALLSVFLSHGADPNCRDNEHNTPLLKCHSLQGSNHILDIVLLLVENGANVHATEVEGIFSAFHKLLVTLQPKQLDSLMEQCSSKIDLSSNGKLPLPPIHGLMLDILSDSRYREERKKEMQLDIIEKVDVLLKYGIDLELTDLHGRTSLHYASWLRFAISIEFLLKKGCKPRSKDVFGRTCLHYSVLSPSKNYKVTNEEEELAALKILSRHMNKDDLEAKDNFGKRVQDLALLEKQISALECMNDGRFDPMRWVLCKTKDDNIKFTIETVKHVIVAICVLLIVEFGWSIIGSICILTCFVISVFSYHPICEHESTKIAGKDLKGEELVNVLLNDRYIGPLVMGDCELKIYSDVSKLVDKISRRLNEIDKNFQCNIELAGSISEETKTLPLDEFDFQFQLSYLSPCFTFFDFERANDVTLIHERANDVTLIHTSTNNPNIGYCLKSGESVSLSMYEKFDSYIFSILNSNDFWKDLPFYWNFLPMGKSVEWIQTTHVTGSSTAPLRLKWIGPKEADVNINIDLVPVIVMPKLPDEIENLIPFQIMNFVNSEQYEWHIICRNSDYARLSFLKVERWILLRLMTELSDAYKLIKSLRSFCGSASDFDPGIITSYMIKNALYFELDPNLSYGLLDEQLISTKYHKPCRVTNKTAYIRIWALRILQRLEYWFEMEDGATVYCRPTAKFPDYFEVVDEYGDHPYIKTIRRMKKLLSAEQ